LCLPHFASHSETTRIKMILPIVNLGYTAVGAQNGLLSEVVVLKRFVLIVFGCFKFGIPFAYHLSQMKNSLERISIMKTIKNVMPTIEDIRSACVAVRMRWSEKERLERRDLADDAQDNLLDMLFPMMNLEMAQKIA
jgi:hypothetical protein